MVMTLGNDDCRPWLHRTLTPYEEILPDPTCRAQLGEAMKHHSRQRPLAVSALMALSLVLSTLGIVSTSAPAQAAAAMVAVSPNAGPDTGGTTVTIVVPQVPSTSFATTVAAGLSHSLAGGATGRVYRWGTTGYGTPEQTIHVPELLPSNLSFVQISAGDNFSLSLDQDGHVFSWGRGDSGVLGNGSTDSSLDPVAVAVPPESAFTQVSAGLDHALALTDRGAVYSWGLNDSKQLGVGTSPSQSSVPIKVSLPEGVVATGISAGGGRMTQVSTLGGYSLVSATDGRVYAWGDLDCLTGDCLDGGSPKGTTKLPAPAGVVFKKVWAGPQHALALDQAGALYAIGNNDFGQLGVGTSGPGMQSASLVKVQLPGGKRVLKADAGFGFSLALMDDGSLYSWGMPFGGRLGIGEDTTACTGGDGWSCSFPTRVTSPSEVVFEDVSASYEHSLAVATDGTVYGWGASWTSALGPDINQAFVPTQIAIVSQPTQTQVDAVSFGGVLAEITRQDGGTVDVLTPPGWAGVVDVIVDWSVDGKAQSPVVYEDAFEYINTHGQATASSLEITGEPVAGHVLTARGSFTNGTPGAVRESYRWQVDGVVLGEEPALSVARDMRGQLLTSTYTVFDEVTGNRTSLSRSVQVAAENPVLPTRVSGRNRYATNYELNKELMRTGMPVFVATGANFPDALSIGPAVALNDGVLILSPRNALSVPTLKLLEERPPSAVYIVGGAGALSQNVVNQLREVTGLVPQRISGGTRYETSAKVFQKFFVDREVSQAFVATGKAFPDALSAAAAGGALAAPVLLVNGQSDTALHSDIRVLLKQKKTDRLTLVGGKNAVNSKLYMNLLQDGFSVERLAGTNRYDTNLAVNRYVGEEIGDLADTRGLWVATGRSFPDALSAGAPAGRASQRLVLSSGHCLMKPVVSEWIHGLESAVDQVTLVGGTSALSDTVMDLNECS